MHPMFEATQKLWTDEITYWTAQMTRVGELLSGEAEKATEAAKATQNAWSEMVKRQGDLMTEYTRHLAAFAEKQVDLLRSAAKAD